MTIDRALREWKSKLRKRGCVSAAAWFCSRVPGFKPLRLTRYTDSGELYQHVVATDGAIVIDLVPEIDVPNKFVKMAKRKKGLIKNERD